MERLSDVYAYLSLHSLFLSTNPLDRLAGMLTVFWAIKGVISSHTN